MSAPRDKTPLKRFGAAVRQRRLELSLSQERLAQIAGIHRNYAGAVERGARNVALLNMIRIARALDVPLASLVAEVDHIPPSSRKSHGIRRSSPPRR